MTSPRAGSEHGTKAPLDVEVRLAEAHGLIGRLVLLLFEQDVDGNLINAAIRGDEPTGLSEKRDEMWTQFAPDTPMPARRVPKRRQP
jgi:hypothetical protein